MSNEITTLINSNFEQNQQIEIFLKNLNYSLNSENSNEKQVLLNYRKNLPEIPDEKYHANLPDDLVLAYYNNFTLLAYIHISLHDESIGIEYIRTLDIYQNKGKCKLLLSVLVILSRLINPNINMIHMNSTNNKLSYLSIFEFYAIPQDLYYKENLISKDDEKIYELKKEIAEMKDNSKEEKYKYIKSVETRFGKTLYIIIDIYDLIIDNTYNLLNRYIQCSKYV